MATSAAPSAGPFASSSDLRQAGAPRSFGPSLELALPQQLAGGSSASEHRPSKSLAADQTVIRSASESSLPGQPEIDDPSEIHADTLAIKVRRSGLPADIHHADSPRSEGSGVVMLQPSIADPGELESHALLKRSDSKSSRSSRISAASVLSTLSKVSSKLSGFFSARREMEKTAKHQPSAFANFGRSASTHFGVRKDYLVADARKPEDGRTRLGHDIAPTVHPGYDNIGDFVRAHRARQQQEQECNQEAAGDDAALVPTTDVRGLAPVTEGDPGEEDGDLLRDEDLEFDEEEEDNWFWNPPGDVIDDLHDAAKSDDVTRIRFLLAGPDKRRHVHPDAEDFDGRTPLWNAAYVGCIKSCASLLDGKANPLARDLHQNIFVDGIWPHEKKPDEYGRIPKNKKTKLRSFSPAGLAALMEDERESARRAQNPGWMDKEEETMPSGRSVIWVLRFKGIFDKVMAACFPGTRVAVVCEIAQALSKLYGKPALVFAAQEGHSQLIELLLKHSAFLPKFTEQPATPTSTRSSSLRGASFSGATTRGLAAQPMQNDVLDLPQPATQGAQLAAYGGEQLTAAGERGEAVLAACRHRQWACAEVLLTVGVPRLSINNNFDNLGRTALHLASQAGEDKVVRLLVACGAETSTRSYLGRQPLHEASIMGKAKVVEELLVGGAEAQAVVGRPEKRYAFDAKGDVGRSAFDIAYTRGKMDVCATLLSFSNDFEGNRGRPERWQGNEFAGQRGRQLY
eukprot:TRINITY_DN35044_c0_g1_i1.p1 TRINITY_DN35044_c0_g1~~TRINITY_DN35044_c0_g1_i1.p1  ORF type:complete len:742 (+),score=123.09 TRINITY_DN35044_c0_g1_i1:211-2436(+)